MITTATYFGKTPAELAEINPETGYCLEETLCMAEMARPSLMYAKSMKEALFCAEECEMFGLKDITLLRSVVCGENYTEPPYVIIAKREE